ncbi:MAG TPA: universal stress protein [Bacteroidota bacterium]
MLDKQIAHAGVQIIVRHGKAASTNVKTARDARMDLIVMSTHGRTGLGHVLMGSVAEKVVRYAPWPVLTMKPEEFREVVALTEEDVAGSLHLHRRS